MSTPNLQLYPARSDGDCTEMIESYYTSTLPYDILSAIFQVYFEDSFTQYPDRPPRPRVNEGPLLVSHVCQYWRDVAFFTPEIWSAFTIDDCVGYPLISHFLDLARESPLSLHVSLWSCIGGHVDTSTLDLLLSRITRWKSIRFWLDEETAEEIIHRFSKAEGTQDGCISMPEASILEEAAIEGGFSVPLETSTKLWSLFLDRSRFPLLQKLHWALDLPHCDSFLLTDHFNWDGLTHLSLSHPSSMTECLLVLQRCTNLQTLCVDFRGAHSASSPTLDSRYLKVDFPNMPLVPPKSLRELIIRVDKPVVGRILGRFAQSHLNCTNFVVDVCA